MEKTAYKLEKEKTLKFIKAFNKINVKNICESKGIRQENVYKAITSLENMNEVKKEIKRQVIELLGSDINE